MTKTFHVAIKAVIVDKNKALILKELDIDGSGREIYDLPGGRIEDRETIEETLERELKEELGLKSYLIGRLISACVHPHYDKNGVGEMLLFYLVKVKNPVIKLSKEHFEFEWITKIKLNQLIKNKKRIHSGIKTALEFSLK